MFDSQELKMYNICTIAIEIYIQDVLLNNGRIIIDKDTFSFVGHLSEDLIVGRYKDGFYKIDFYFIKHFAEMPERDILAEIFNKLSSQKSCDNKKVIDDYYYKYFFDSNENDGYNYVGQIYYYKKQFISTQLNLHMNDVSDLENILIEDEAIQIFFGEINCNKELIKAVLNENQDVVEV